jgi:hypothetical protein
MPPSTIELHRARLLAGLLLLAAVFGGGATALADEDFPRSTLEIRSCAGATAVQHPHRRYARKARIAD